MRQCCVIGGAGFIGSRVVERLLAAGRKVRVVGRSSRPSRPISKGVAYHCGDLGDERFLRDALQGVDEVIDLAYTTVPKTSFENPVGDILDNLPAAVTLLRVAGEMALEKVVVVSSGGVIYGKAEQLPLTEDHPTNPISPYGITKLAVEKYALMYGEACGLPVVCVRPANAYGEGQRPFAGQGFVATAMASILQGKEVPIYGENGTIRDYIHVTDVAKGIIAALEHGVPGSCYNVGTCVGRSNREVLEVLFRLARAQGFQPTLKVLPLRQFDVPANVLDSAKLFAVSGWQAEIPFAAGMERTWKWFCGLAAQEDGPPGSSRRRP